MGGQGLSGQVGRGVTRSLGEVCIFRGDAQKPFSKTLKAASLVQALGKGVQNTIKLHEGGNPRWERKITKKLKKGKVAASLSCQLPSTGKDWGVGAL